MSRCIHYSAFVADGFNIADKILCCAGCRARPESLFRDLGALWSFGSGHLSVEEHAPEKGQLLDQVHLGNISRQQDNATFQGLKDKRCVTQHWLSPALRRPVDERSCRYGAGVGNHPDVGCRQPVWPRVRDHGGNRCQGALGVLMRGGRAGRTGGLDPYSTELNRGGFPYGMKGDSTCQPGWRLARYGQAIF